MNSHTQCLRQTYFGAGATEYESYHYRRVLGHTSIKKGDDGDGITCCENNGCVLAKLEQFILRVPPNVAERIERLLNENNPSSSEDKSLDLSFSEDGRSGTFVIGNEHFPASLLDLPCVVESFKTYDDSSLIKTSDIGQMIMVRESGDAAPDVVEHRHGLTPPMRDARKRRFRREPDLNPELVSRVEKDLLNIMAGGTAGNLDVEAAEQEGGENARGANKKPAPAPVPKHDAPETLTNAGDPDRSDSDESDDSV